MSLSPSLPAAECEVLYKGILVCRDTVRLVAQCAMMREVYGDDDCSLFNAALDLVDRRLSELALLVDSGVLFNRAKILEERHV
jgi:hypothetical protein